MEGRVANALFTDLKVRLKHALENYPDPNPNFKALISEVGELAESLINHERYEDNTYSEAIDVAATALRVALQTMEEADIELVDGPEIEYGAVLTSNQEEEPVEEDDTEPEYEFEDLRGVGDPEDDDPRPTLAEAPAGLFLYNDTLCFKTEYKKHGKTEAYVVETGEYFYGEAGDKQDREQLKVDPVDPEQGDGEGRTVWDEPKPESHRWIKQFVESVQDGTFEEEYRRFGFDESIDSVRWLAEHLEWETNMRKGYQYDLEQLKQNGER